MPLWLEALARHEADFQRQAADAITRAHSLGTSGLQESQPRLMAIVSEDATNRAARFAAVNALITLAAQDSASAPFAASKR
ncbi:MAG TPA: phycocyanin alpha phycocyanobilin lyase, partial [Planctomycetaceae bacterium]|nr:phycocyanin alpha phycocyanobilin lyase [Planctomycetaceae bacterium]